MFLTRRHSGHFKIRLGVEYSELFYDNVKYITSFYQRFLDNKIYQCDYNNEFEKVSLIAPDEFIFCGFVDFQMKINSNAFLQKQISEKNDKIKNLERLVLQLQRQSNLGISVNKKKEIIYKRKIIPRIMPKNNS